MLNLGLTYWTWLQIKSEQPRFLSMGRNDLCVPFRDNLIITWALDKHIMSGFNPPRHQCHNLLGFIANLARAFPLLELGPTTFQIYNDIISTRIEANLIIFWSPEIHGTFYTAVWPCAPIKACMASTLSFVLSHAMRLNSEPVENCHRWRLVSGWIHFVACTSRCTYTLKCVIESNAGFLLCVCLKLWFSMSWKCRTTVLVPKALLGSFDSRGFHECLRCARVLQQQGLWCCWNDICCRKTQLTGITFSTTLVCLWGFICAPMQLRHFLRPLSVKLFPHVRGPPTSLAKLATRSWILRRQCTKNLWMSSQMSIFLSSTVCSEVLELPVGVTLKSFSPFSADKSMKKQLMLHCVDHCGNHKQTNPPDLQTDPSLLICLDLNLHSHFGNWKSDHVRLRKKKKCSQERANAISLKQAKFQK